MTYTEHKTFSHLPTLCCVLCKWADLSKRQSISRPEHLHVCIHHDIKLLSSGRASSSHALESPAKPESDNVVEQADKIATGHNADDIAETVLLNILRGDLPRLSRCAAIITGADPLKVVAVGYVVISTPSALLLFELLLSACMLLGIMS